MRNDVPGDVSYQGKSKYSFVVSQDPEVGFYLTTDDNASGDGNPFSVIYRIKCADATNCSFDKIPGMDVGVKRFGQGFVALSQSSDFCADQEQLGKV